MYKAISDLCRIEYGASPNKVRSDDNTGIEIYGTGGKVGFSKEALFQEPLVVVARKGTLDNPILVDNPCWVIDTAYAAIPNCDVDVRWLFYQLLLFDLKRLNESTGVPSISRDYLKKQKIVSQELDVQRKIADILSTVDDVIEKTEAAIEKYQAIKAGMMQDLFTRGIDTQTGKLRPRIEEAPELYKESELGWIPKEWEAGRFGDICKVKAGYSFKSSEFGSNGYRLIRISNIQEYTVKNLENDVFITPNLSTQEYELKLGDLLIALSGATTGKVGLVKRESLPALLNQRVGLFEPQDNTSIDYVYQIVSDDSYQKSILDNCPSSAQPNVSPKYLEAILIKYAKDQHEQALIVRLLKSIDSTIETEYNQLKKSLKLKQGLMADLLSGKVRVNLNHDKVENR